MRIGLDARFLTHPQRGGFKTYTHNLVTSLSCIDSENDYIVYIDRDIDPFELPSPKNFAYHVVGSKMPVLGMPWREQIWLRRHIERDRLDLVHFLCNTGAVNLGIRSVVTLHDTIPLTSPQGAHGPIRASTIKRWAIDFYSRSVISKVSRDAERIITVSEFERAEIVRHLNIPADQISVTHLAPSRVFHDEGNSQVRASGGDVGLPAGITRPFLLTVGFEPRKNIPLVINAFSHLTSIAGLGLVIVAAERASRDRFHQLADRLGVAERVTILGPVSPTQLAVLYKSAEIFIFASERESFGLPPLEAMACGTPVIAMGRTSMPEVLSPAAKFVDGNATEMWAEAIGSLLTDLPARKQLVRQGQQHVRKYSWDRCAVETVAVYRSVLATPARHHQTRVSRPG